MESWNIAITGHRPNRLGGADNMFNIQNSMLPRHLIKVEAGLVIQGMCQGVDLMAAKAAYRLGIPFVNIRPWAGHTVPQEWKKDYDMALRKAQQTIIINPSESFPGNEVYLERNRFMIDNADILLAFWDGSDGGGTQYTVSYALTKKVSVLKIDPFTGREEWLKNAKTV